MNNLLKQRQLHWLKQIRINSGCVVVDERKNGELLGAGKEVGSMELDSENANYVLCNKVLHRSA